MVSLNAKADERKAAAPKKTVARKAEPSLVERVMDFSHALRATGDPTKGLPADKGFIDSLFEYDGGDFAHTDIEAA